MIAWLIRWLWGEDDPEQVEESGTDGPPEHWLPLVSGEDDLLP